MSSANYIPLTQISPSEFLGSSKRHPAQFSSYLSRKTTLLVLVAATSLITLVVFLNSDASNDGPFQSNYIAVPVPDALPPSARPKLRPVRDLPAECLERYYALGELCHDARGHIPIDIVWTWVNGSDPLFGEAKDRAAREFAQDDPDRPIQAPSASRMYRDHDELRHSIRSALANFRPYVNRFHVLTSDIDYPDNDLNSSVPNISLQPPGPGYWRLGLQPQWLDNSQTEWRDGNILLSLTHHAHFFEPYNHSSFNSYGIESQFPHLQGISEILIYMNDDFFMVKPLTPESFYTHQYGVVLRLDNYLRVSPELKPSDTGEWLNMGIANSLLSKRFGSRERSYVSHVPKAIHFPILQELALIWPDVLTKAADHAFRERVGKGNGDFYTMFAFAQFLIERSREALLWAWSVGRIGGLDDSWGETERTRAWFEVGGELEGPHSEEVEWDAAIRDTLQQERVEQNIKDSGIEGNFRTRYQFSSLDGYAYNPYGKRTTGDWPGFEPDTDPNASESEARKQLRCRIRRDECFGLKPPDGKPVSASAIFQEIAFNKPHCGDCIMVALTRASGRNGLSAFLPSPDRVSPASTEHPLDSAEEIPHLPLVADWHDGQFALRDVMKYAPNTNVREWSMRLMQRYRYVIGATPYKFEMMFNLPQVQAMLTSIDIAADVAMLCVNDDLTKNNVTKEHEKVDKFFRKWQDKRWPAPGAWEADVHR